MFSLLVRYGTGKGLSQFYNSVEKLGFVAGGEFKAAVEEARRLGAPVLLGDRDVDVTLQRLVAALGTVDNNK
jgi:pheromone shutdown protein TraB